MRSFHEKQNQVIRLIIAKMEKVKEDNNNTELTGSNAEKDAYVWQKIYEKKWSVSPYFLHHYEDKNEAGMVFLNKLSLKTLGAYTFIVFWLKMQFELCD